MVKVIHQPASGPSAQEHLESTIYNLVPIARMQPFLSQTETDTLHNLYGNGAARVWGVTESMQTPWARIEPGDIVVFTQDNRLFLTSQVTLTLRNRDLAFDLWRLDDRGRVWECIYFLGPIQNINIPIAQFRQTVGYRPGWISRGFIVLDQDKSDRFIAAFEPDLARREYRRIADAVLRDRDPNRPIQALARREQAYLRLILLQGRESAQCGICGDTFPQNLLVAAHIKPRRHCTQAEIFDIPAIAMPMCRLGCDSLFDSGYLAVIRGVVQSRIVAEDPPRLADELGRLQGRRSLYWSDDRAEYFRWHEQHVARPI